MAIQWDDEKAASNLRKHGVSFERASDVFDDEFADTDDQFASGERRLVTIGLISGIGLVIVVHTHEHEGTAEEVIRIISARRANRRERKAYENG